MAIPCLSSKIRLKQPAPLPTKQEIHDFAIILKGIEIWTTWTVVVVGPHFLIKYASRTNQTEGGNLLFAEQNLRIPAPRLYALWQEPDGVMYTIMEFIPSGTLDSLLPKLTKSSKTVIVKKLRRFSTDKIVAFSGFCGSAGGGCMPYYLFWIPSNDKSVSGPLTGERDHHFELAKKSRINWADNNRHSYMADSIERQLPHDFGSSHLPPFSPSDVQRKNILVREMSLGDQNTPTEENFIVSMMDWGVIGWYPSY